MVAAVVRIGGGIGRLATVVAWGSWRARGADRDSGCLRSHVTMRTGRVKPKEGQGDGQSQVAAHNGSWLGTDRVSTRLQAACPHPRRCHVRSCRRSSVGAGPFHSTCRQPYIDPTSFPCVPIHHDLWDHEAPHGGLIFGDGVCGAGCRWSRSLPPVSFSSPPLVPKSTSSLGWLVGQAMHGPSQLPRPRAWIRRRLTR